MIPMHMLRQRATVEPYLATTGAGNPAYGPAVSYPCSLQERRRVLKDRNGKQVISAADATFRPDAQVAEQSRVTCEGRTYTVVAVLTVRGATRPHELEVALQ